MPFVTNPDFGEGRKGLESKHGKVWDTGEMRSDFNVTGFGGGLVVVTRKSDGVRGSLDFTHFPRFYYNFMEH